MACSTHTQFRCCCNKCYFTSLNPFKTFYPQTAKLPGGLLWKTAEWWVYLTIQKTYELCKHGRWQHLNNDLYVAQEIISAWVKDPFCKAAACGLECWWSCGGAVRPEVLFICSNVFPIIGTLSASLWAGEQKETCTDWGRKRETSNKSSVVTGHSAFIWGMLQ